MAYQNFKPVSKNVTVKGTQKTVLFYWGLDDNRSIEIKEYKKRTRWGTFTQKETLCNCYFMIDNKRYDLQTIFVELAGGGYSRYFLVDGIKFPDSHKKVIEHLLTK